MMPPRSSRTLKIIIISSVVIGGVINLLFFFHNSNNCPLPGILPYQYSEIYNSTSHELPDKPILLLWFWPENYRFSLSDCKSLLGIDGCFLTDDRSLYSEAHAVLVFHKAIKSDLSNLPQSPRPHFQRWIWFHVESPTNTVQIDGLENLFNLTLNYRQDADIVVHHHLKIRKDSLEETVIPKKDKLVCVIVSNSNPETGTDVRNRYFHELKNHITVHVFGTAFGRFLDVSEYYPTIASCKFYLAFENSIYWDYITEKLNGPLVVGTVPVVLGPPRENYENYIPGSAFIHVNDFPSAKELAEYLLQLDSDDDLYLSYFEWRKHFYAEPHLIMRNQEFIKPICTACEYIHLHKEYKMTKDIYKWYFSINNDSNM
ncbi:4-galactosyl-N-acetylglucosaminide 3-alpha-L-fucosyltransferase 9-like [Trichomycterus rosablanca]|uniref:4-galactosyl-N-acetylglucosaminide 3-alpha-L-fucosyltransferase 9-like n=1 Tax=Trichomycterus rosablanca TaxID=2290929 RepID=UPI002F35DE37